MDTTEGASVGAVNLTACDEVQHLYLPQLC